MRRVHGQCPTCDTTSSVVHSRYERRPADLPSIGQPRTLRLRVRRFYCCEIACRRRTLAESLPKLMPPRARLARRLTVTGFRSEVAAYWPLRSSYNLSVLRTRGRHVGPPIAEGCVREPHLPRSVGLRRRRTFDCGYMAVAGSDFDFCGTGRGSRSMCCKRCLVVRSAALIIIEQPHIFCHPYAEPQTATATCH